MENKEDTMRIGSKWSLLRDALHRFFLFSISIPKNTWTLFLSTDYTNYTELFYLVNNYLQLKTICFLLSVIIVYKQKQQPLSELLLIEMIVKDQLQDSCSMLRER